MYSLNITILFQCVWAQASLGNAMVNKITLHGLKFTTPVKLKTFNRGNQNVFSTMQPNLMKQLRTSYLYLIKNSHEYLLKCNKKEHNNRHHLLRKQGQGPKINIIALQGVLNTGDGNMSKICVPNRQGKRRHCNHYKRLRWLKKKKNTTPWYSGLYIGLLEMSNP